MELLLVDTDELAIAISRLAAYPTGFSFEVLVLTSPRPGGPERLDPLMFGHFGPRPRPDMLRIGVQFADGAKATNMSSFRPGDEPPTGPVLNSHGSSGGGGRFRTDAWVWPLPPPGPLAFVCEWPAINLPLTRREIEAELILEAAQKARVIFSEDGLPDPPPPPNVPASGR